MPEPIRSETAARVRSAAPLVAAASARVAWLSASLAEISHVVELADADGFVVLASGADPLGDLGGLGRCWSRAAIGASALGNALSSGMAARVCGGQHDRRELRGVAGAAAPIRRSGAIVGAVGIRTRRDAFHACDTTLVAHVAHEIERDLSAPNGAPQPRSVRSPMQPSEREAIDFIGVASHELRHPLADLLRDLDALSRRRDLPPDVCKTLESMTSGATRLGARMATLTDLARLATGRIELVLELVDLGAVVHTVCERARIARSFEPCVLRVDAAPRVIGDWDRARLEQIVSNLLAYAVETWSGAAVTLEVRRTPLSATLCVRTLGHRAGPPTAPAGAAGIALCTARWMVEAHGGSLRVGARGDGRADLVVELPIRPSLFS